MKVNDCDFKNVDITLDDNSYTGCSFTDCRIVYSGGSNVTLRVNTFNNCRWEFAGAAANTLAFLREMYHNMNGDQLVERTFAMIRTPPA